MKARIFLTAALLFVSGLVLGAPMAAAQAPANYYTFKLEWAHPEMPVPENGRGDMPLTISGEASGFVCAQPEGCKVSTELKLDSFAKWAGSSLEPFTATFTIPSGSPGQAVQTYTVPTEVKLNLAWDVETAPKKGATQTYVVSTGNMKLEGLSVATAQPRQAKSAPMVATLPDRPEVVNATAPVDCSMDPFAPACATMTSEAPAESPAIDTAVLLGALAVFAIAFRRRRA